MNASTSDPTLTGSAYPDVNELSSGAPSTGTGGLSGASSGLGSSGLSGGTSGASGGSGAALSGGASSMSEGSTSGGSSTAADGSTLDRVVQGAHAALDRAAERARPMAEKLRGTLGGSGESLLGDRAEEWKAMHEQYMTQARSFVREHPLATVAGAIVAGMLLSRMMDDR